MKDIDAHLFETMDPELLAIRHSTAHIMAQAVMEIFPEARLAIGPPTAEGFYYDFELPRPLTPEDLDEITKRMKRIVKKNYPFELTEKSREEAIRYFEERGQPYKVELIASIPEGERITFYTQGDFTDLCEGPHVKSTRACRHFKLLSIAGAYWRGDEQNPMLQRIYGTAFKSREELDHYLWRLEEAKKRDHRRLGKELDLFSFHAVAPASPFFHPRGAFIYNTLIDFMRERYRQHGYEEVITPQILDVELWHKSGHYDNYKENMYFTRIDDREFAVKPMNCPASAYIYGAVLRSYRDLPLRLADFGRLHRYERSGATHGLTRVRTFCQDDAHIYCTPEQIDGEISALIEMILDTYRVFGFEDVRIELSTRPEKSIGSDEIWERSEQALSDALEKKGIAFRVNPGDGAFYGPKIDFHVLDALDRSWQLGTIQLDFSLPERFDLNYTAPSGGEARPVVIHRAILGSIERFMGILIEHCAGAFPLWLAPLQAIVLPIADRHHPYAREVAAQLDAFRVKVDERSEKVQHKIRDAEVKKIPYMLVVGDQEVDAGTVSVRSYFEGRLGTMPVAALADRMGEEVTQRLRRRITKQR